MPWCAKFADGTEDVDKDIDWCPLTLLPVNQEKRTPFGVRPSKNRVLERFADLTTSPVYIRNRLLSGSQTCHFTNQEKYRPVMQQCQYVGQIEVRAAGNQSPRLPKKRRKPISWHHCTGCLGTSPCISILCANNKALHQRGP